MNYFSRLFFSLCVGGFFAFPAIADDVTQSSVDLFSTIEANVVTSTTAEGVSVRTNVVKLILSVPRRYGDSTKPTVFRNPPKHFAYRMHGASGSGWSKLKLREVNQSFESNVNSASWVEAGTGNVLDPYRWERYFIGEAPVTDDVDAFVFTSEEVNIASKYEWVYFGGAVGNQVFSDIQDPARYQTFSNTNQFSFSSPTEGITSTRFAKFSSAKGVIAPWVLKNATLGARSDNDPVAAQMLNIAYSEGVDGAEDGAIITSPIYSDGVGSISFNVRAFTAEQNSLEVQIRDVNSSQSSWITLGDSISVDSSSTPRTISYSYADLSDLVKAYNEGFSSTDKLDLSRNIQIRFIRTSAVATVGLDEDTIQISSVTVQSAPASAKIATNVAIFSPGYPAASAPWSIRAELVAESVSPADATVTATLSRKISGLEPSFNPEISFNLVKQPSTTAGTKVFAYEFEPYTLTKDAANVTADSYIKDSSGRLISVLPQVYTYSLTGSVQGSFKAGRIKSLDERETFDLGEEVVTGTLDLREFPTTYEQVQMKINVKNPETSSEIMTEILEMEPIAENRWRGLLRVDGYNFKASTEPTISGVDSSKVAAFTFNATKKYSAGGYSANPVIFGVATQELADPISAFSGNATAAAAAKEILINLTNVPFVAVVTFNTETREFLISTGLGQDFNSWTSSSALFGSTESVKGQVQRLTTFDSRISNGTLTGGWYPDAGPFASSQTLMDYLDLSTNKVDATSAGISFNLNTDFRWGLSYNRTINTLPAFATDGIYFGANKMVEHLRPLSIFENRTSDISDDKKSYISGLVRMSEGATFEPLPTVKLSGFGEVKIKGATTLIGTPSDSLIFMPKSYGLTGTVEVPEASPTAYSVSMRAFGSYEFRLSQVADVTTTGSNVNTTRKLVAEIYLWTGTSYANLVTNNITTFANLSLSKSPMTMALYSNENNKLVAQFGNTTWTTDIDVVGSGRFGFFSSACSAKFSALNYYTANNRATSESLKQDDILEETGLWEINYSEATGLSCTRRVPATTFTLSKILNDGLNNEMQSVAFWTTSKLSFEEHTFEVKESGDWRISMSVSGAPALVDSVKITSWRGNDGNKTGKSDFRARYTDNFTAAGVWIKPTNDSELNSSKQLYSGSQSMLFQWSRRNSTKVFSSLPNGTAAVVSPFSTNGFGVVSFSYKVPTGPATFKLQYYRRASEANNFWVDIDDSWAWQDVSGLVELLGTGFATIKPVINPTSGIQTELRGADYPGYLRLVMVQPGDAGLDPVCEIDDLNMPDYPLSTGEEWTAENVKINSDPTSELYWKDRIVGDEERFASSQTLTARMILNNSQNEDTESGATFSTSYLLSPVLTNGIGVVSFAARQLEETYNDNGVHLYLETTESMSEPITWQRQATFTITNKLYSTYSADLAKIPNSRAKSQVAFRLRAILKDGFDVSEEEKQYAGRVSLDKVVVEDPITPSLRVANVVFARKPNDFENSTTNFVDATGISRTARTAAQQYLQGGDLYVQVSLDRFILEPKVKAVYLTYKADTPKQDVKFTGLDGQENTSIGWDNANKWGRNQWFNIDSVAANVSITDSAFPKNTIMLKYNDVSHAYEGAFPKSATVAVDGNNSVIETPLASLSKNDIVQYTVWVQFTDDSDSAIYTTQIREMDYKNLPWYFPRDLNNENKSDGFSPYFFVYDVAPGEAFINEINSADTNVYNNRAKLSRFVELCVPVETGFANWSLVNYADDFSMSYDDNVNFDSSYRLPNDDRSSIAGTGVKMMIDGKETNTYRDFMLLADYEFVEDDKHFAPEVNIRLTDGIRIPTSSASSVRGVRLIRDNGAYEHSIAYSTFEASRGTIENFEDSDPSVPFYNSDLAWTVSKYTAADKSVAEKGQTSLGTIKMANPADWVAFTNEVSTAETPADDDYYPYTLFTAENVTPGWMNVGQTLTVYEGSQFYSVESKITGGLGLRQLSQNSVEVGSSSEPDASWSISTHAENIDLLFVPAIQHNLSTFSIQLMLPTGVEWKDDDNARVVATDMSDNSTINVAIAFDADTSIVTITPETSFNLGLGVSCKVSLPVLGNVKSTASFEQADLSAVFNKIATYCGSKNPQPWQGDNFGFSVDVAEPAISDSRYTVPFNTFITSVTIQCSESVTLESSKSYIIDKASSDSEASFNNQSLVVKGDFTPETKIYFTASLHVTDPITKKSFSITMPKTAYHFPDWYAPLTWNAASDENPYFFIYSTPPESVWINEVNFATASQIEVVGPKLGYDTDPLTDTTQVWKLRLQKEGVATPTDPITLTFTDAATGNATWNIYTAGVTLSDSTTTVAISLLRPCGVAEGGVVTKTDSTGNTPVTPSADLKSLLTTNVVNGVTDVLNTGSIGIITNAVGASLEFASGRTTWIYNSSDTIGKPNDDSNLPLDPEWNKITVSSKLMNDTTSGTGGGRHIVGTEFSHETGSITNFTFSGAPTTFNGWSITYLPLSKYKLVKIVVPENIISQLQVTVNNTPPVVGSWAEPTALGLIGVTFGKDEANQPTGEIIFTEIDGGQSFDSTVPITLTLTAAPDSSFDIHAHFSRGELDSFVVSETLFKLNATTGSPEEDYYATATGPILGNDLNNGWRMRPSVGDKFGIMTVLEGRDYGISDATEVYLAWSHVPKSKLNLTDGSFAVNWQMPNWLGVSNAATPTTFDKMEKYLALPNTLSSTGGVFKLTDITADYAADFPVNFATGADGASPLYRAYRTAVNDGIDTSPDSFNSGDVLRFAIVYVDGSGNIVWQSMKTFAYQPYSPFIAENSNINRQVWPDDLTKGSPYTFLNSVAVGSVWINEFKPAIATGNNGDFAFPSTFIEIAAKTDNGEKPKKASLKGWKIEMLEASYDTRTLTNSNFAIQRTIVLTNDWGTISDPDNKLSFYPLVSNPDAFATMGYNTVEKFQTYSGDLFNIENVYEDLDNTGIVKLYAMRLLSDSGSVEQEILFFPEVSYMSTDIYGLKPHWDAIMQREKDAYPEALITNLSFHKIDGKSDDSFQLLANYNDQTDIRWFTYPPNNFGTFTLVNRSFLVDGEGLVQPYIEPPIKTKILSASVMSGLGSISSWLSSNTAGIEENDMQQQISTRAISGSEYKITLNPVSAWYTVGSVYKNNEPLDVATSKANVIATQSFSAQNADTVNSVTLGGVLEESTTYAVSFKLKEDAQKLADAGAIDPLDQDQMQSLSASDIAEIIAAYEADGVTPEEKYLLGLNPTVTQQVKLEIDSFAQNDDGRWFADLSLDWTDSTRSTTEPVGVVILVGRAALSDEWEYVGRIQDVKALFSTAVLYQIPETKFRFFKALLLSPTKAAILAE